MTPSLAPSGETLPVVSVAFALAGGELDPDRVTARLGIEPTSRPGDGGPAPGGHGPGFFLAEATDGDEPDELPDGASDLPKPVEVYDKRGRHRGEFDPDTGQQTKPPNPRRRVEP